MKQVGTIILVLICLVIGYNVNLGLETSRKWSIKVRLGDTISTLKKIETLQSEYYKKNGRYATNFKELSFSEKDTEQRYKYVLCESIIDHMSITDGTIYNLPEYYLRCPDPKTTYYVYAVFDFDSDNTRDIFMLSNDHGIVHISDDVKQ